MKSKYFASLNGKEITLLGDAVPEHDLLENQIPLTYEEFKLLKACSSIEKAKSLYSSVEAKIEAVEIGGITQWVGQEPTSNPKYHVSKEWAKRHLTLDPADLDKAFGTGNWVLS